MGNVFWGGRGPGSLHAARSRARSALPLVSMEASNVLESEIRGGVRRRTARRTDAALAQLHALLWCYFVSMAKRVRDSRVVGTF